jgi:hypothetical protein
MFKLAIAAAILPAAAWWGTTYLAQAAMSEPDAYALYHSGDLPSASCLAKSAAYLVFGQMTRGLTDISHWD